MIDNSAKACFNEYTTYSQLLFEEDVEAIKEIETGLGGIDMFTGIKRKGSSRFKPSKLTTEHSQMLGAANVEFTRGNLSEALVHLKVLIKECPNASEPWLTVSTIFEEMGEVFKAQNALFMAAFLSTGAGELWKKIARQSMYH
jgi:hypothetical protein